MSQSRVRFTSDAFFPFVVNMRRTLICSLQLRSSDAESDASSKVGTPARPRVSAGDSSAACSSVMASRPASALVRLNLVFSRMSATRRSCAAVTTKTAAPRRSSRAIRRRPTTLPKTSCPPGTWRVAPCSTDRCALSYTCRAGIGAATAAYEG
jgi:hypothetical protein